MSARRESGFTLIEIMIVMAIIVTLVGLVSVVVPKAIDRGKRLECGNNLKQIGTLLVTRHSEKGWPSDRGAGFLLRVFVENDELQAAAEVYICPGDEQHLYRDASPEDYRDKLLEELSKFKGKSGREGLISGLEWDLVSYAGRTKAVPKEGNEKVPLGADRQGTNGDQLHHPGGLNVLYKDGSVAFRDRKYLFGSDDGQDIVIGLSPRLEDLGYESTR